MSRYLLLVPFIVGCAAAAETKSSPAGPDAEVTDTLAVDEDTGAPTDEDTGAPTDEDTGSAPVVDGGTPDSAAPPTDTAPPPSDECKSYPFAAETLLAEKLGFGASAKGGDPKKVFRVKSLADSGPTTLRAALESTEAYWIVFDVEGTILLGDNAIRPKSNKTVDGRGRAIVVDGLFKIDAGTKNLIFTDLTLQYPRGFKTSSGDTISISGHAGTSADAYDTRDMWFHHLELGRSGDGQIDVRGGTNITISWTHLHSHAKAFLHQKDADNLPSPFMRITYHHNWFDKITRRGPLFYYGQADFFNNWQYQWYEFGASSNSGAQFLSENNIYEARPGTYCIPGCPDPNSPTGDSDYQVSKEALVSGWAGDPGSIKSVGDLALEGAKITTKDPTKVFDRSTFYAAKPEVANAELKARLKALTGPRKTYCK